MAVFLQDYPVAFLADITKEISNHRTRSQQGLIYSARTWGRGYYEEHEGW